MVNVSKTYFNPLKPNDYFMYARQQLYVCPPAALCMPDSSFMYARQQLYVCPPAALCMPASSFMYACQQLYVCLPAALTFINSTHLCVLCGSQNKQRLFPYTTLTDWFL
jgi:hypothetical protein